MRKQKCIVRNKSQLIAAFTCALDVPFQTEISLIRENGSIISYLLDPIRYINSYVTKDFYSGSSQSSWNKSIRKAICNIRKTPVEAFK